VVGKCDRLALEQIVDNLLSNALEAAEASPQERIAEAITSFTRSMSFVYLHLALYAAWILANLGVLPGSRDSIRLLSSLRWWLRSRPSSSPPS
jgi:uncharacterized membrane protein